MSQKIKVLFCTDGIFPHMVGGMQRHSRLLVEALAKHPDVELTVVHPHPGIRVFEGLDHVQEIALDPLPEKKNYLIELYDFSKEVLRLALERPDHVIYSQGLCIWAGIDKVAHRTIVNPHGLEPYQTLDVKTKLKTLPFRMIFDRIFRNAAYSVSLGGRLTDILARRMGNKRSRIVVLPNATNPVALPEGYRKVRDGKVHFLFAGRFAYNKGIDTLLEAAEILRKQGYEGRFEVSLVGKGPLFQEMQARFAFPEIQFLGFVPDEGLDDLYMNAHVFVLPTLFEGMPTVVLEAMARAMPILVTDVGATLELVDERNGIIIPKKDAAGLAVAMQKMMDCREEEFEAMSRRSLEKFLERFTWKAVAEQHLALFQKVNARLQKD